MIKIIFSYKGMWIQPYEDNRKHETKKEEKERNHSTYNFVSHIYLRGGDYLLI